DKHDFSAAWAPPLLRRRFRGTTESRSRLLAVRSRVRGGRLMRVLHLVLIVGFVVVVGAVGAGFLDLAEVPFLIEFARRVKAYSRAKTPDEALDRYKKALEERNYEMAARYLDGDYAVQLRKQAKVAGRLGKAIDTFRSTAKDRSLINDKVELMLARIEPFPKTISVKDVKTEGDKAAALIVSETPSRFVPRSGLPVALKKTDGIWRIDLPLTGNAREILDYLERNGQDVVNAL